MFRSAVHEVWGLGVMSCRFRFVSFSAFFKRTDLLFRSREPVRMLQFDGFHTGPGPLIDSMIKKDLAWMLSQGTAS